MKNFKETPQLSATGTNILPQQCFLMDTASSSVPVDLNLSWPGAGHHRLHPLYSTLQGFMAMDRIPLSLLCSRLSRSYKGGAPSPTASLWPSTGLFPVCPCLFLYHGAQNWLMVDLSRSNCSAKANSRPKRLEQQIWLLKTLSNSTPRPQCSVWELNLTAVFSTQCILSMGSLHSIHPLKPPPTLCSDHIQT